MSKKLYVCIYGGASEKIDSYHKEQVEKLAETFAKNGFDLVYGGGSEGCMGAAARGIHKGGGKIFGVIPEFMGEFESLYNCDKTQFVDSMSKRKDIMESHTDVFVITPGGVGTMDEFFQILTLKYLHQMETPIIVLNTNGFYDKMFEFIENIIEQKAAVEKLTSYYDVITDADDKKVLEIMNKVKEEHK